MDHEHTVTIQRASVNKVVCAIKDSTPILRLTVDCPLDEENDIKAITDLLIALPATVTITTPQLPLPIGSVTP